MTNIATIREQFLAQHLKHWPGEATTLGLREFDSSLKDLSPDAIADELSLHRATQAALDQLDPNTLNTEERLDALMMSTFHGFQQHIIEENQDHLINITMSLHPYQIVQFQQRVSHETSAWEALSNRVSEIPRFLKQQEALLTQGVAEGRTPDRDVLSFVAANQCPQVATFFEDFPQQSNVALTGVEADRFQQRCIAASRAYSDHGDFLQKTVCPTATLGTLGPEEYRWRLKHTLGIASNALEMIEQARDILSTAGEQLISQVRPLADRPIRTLREALAFVMEDLNTPFTERDEDVIESYLAIHERTKSHMRKHQLFHFGDEVDTLGFHPMPAAFTEIGAVTNIAAPLLDLSGQAFFLIQEKAHAHRGIQAGLLAIHEGIPGHSFQSIWWQTHRDRRPHPVRFLSVPDEIAVAQQYFGTMMNIEGWATYAEVLMAEHGFYSPQERLWELWTKIAHASRVVVDASLHTHRMTVPQAEAFLAEDAGWPEAWAIGEVRRYRQIPLQSICYLMGRLEIIELRKQCQDREGAAFKLADFHDRLFAAGPVPAGHLQRVWAEAEEDGGATV